MDKLYLDLEEILDEEVKREDVLDDFEEWDSLGVLTVVAMLDENYGICMGADEIKKLKTVGDIEDLIREKKGV